MKYILLSPLDDMIYIYSSLEKATKAAIQKNKRDRNHPYFKLWEVNEKKTKYIGRLFRSFGHDFDPKNCWDNA